MNKLISLLEGLGLRLCEETEIGLAIMYSSCLDQCNPSSAKLKLTRQTIADTCPQYDFESQSYDSKRKSAISDSLAIQFEHKIEDLLIVPETPPEKDQSIIKNTKSPNDFEKLKGSYDMTQNKKLDFSENTIDPRSPKDHDLTSKKTQKNKLDYSDDNLMDDDPEQSYPAVEVKKLKISTDNNIRPSLADNKSKIVVKRQNIAPSVKSEPLASTASNVSLMQHTKLDTNVVYSKRKPPKHTIKAEQDENACQITSQIKFASLVCPKKETNLNTSSHVMPDGKANFKKFVKIPKVVRGFNSSGFVMSSSTAATSAKSSITKTNKKSVNRTQTNKNVSLFKNFKDEPFNVDTQFKIFLNSQR
jgi:hypothetical protein